MLIRSALFASIPLLVAAGASATPATDTQDVTLAKPVQIPEAVLQPGKYTIRLEDHLTDRAIVRITEAGGADHYLLTVPSKKLKSVAKGLIFFPNQADTQVLRGWSCTTCQKPLEFVYPKDEAVKLTGQTGRPILAFDPSYDKLPANLSPEDRKVVTLWLLAPKTVTPEGKGEGLTAAKYGTPKLVASAQPLPKKMPKTASSAYSEIAFGLTSLGFAALLVLRRKTPIAGTGGRHAE